MKTQFILGALAVMLVAAVPARADHKALPTEAAVEPGRSAAPDTTSLDIDIKLGLDGFRFGSRLFGREGYTGGAWLNGQTRPEGFSVDGRLERDGKAHNFKLNVEIDEWLRRAARWLGPGRTDL